MRIRTLSFAGVGPYRDNQHIDFDQLGGTGLYLISGPTGAGKSTIIDAIVFALYGRLSGDDSDESRLRSDFSTASDKTVVDLVFETADGVFRVIRTPKYMRFKRGGEGLTEEKATCKLFRVKPDGSEEEVATQIASANAELQNKLGLTADQFLQTVVLPQGQFATFLRAKTKERAEILKKIFGTKLYERVAEILKDQAKVAREAKDVATTAIREAVLAIDTQIGLDEAAKQQALEQVQHSLDDSLLAALALLEPELQADAAQRSAEAAACMTAAVAADLARARARQEAEAASAVDKARMEVADAYSSVLNARVPVATATALAESIGITVDLEADEQTWRTRAVIAAKELGALNSALEAEVAVAAWPERLASIELRIRDIQEQANRDKTQLEALPSRIAEVESTAATRPTADATKALLDRKQLLVAEADLYAKLDVERQKQPTLQASLDAASREAVSSNNQYKAASDAFIEGLASTLALKLRDDMPCPVCGSIAHPAPASPTGARISKDQVDALNAAASSARAALVRAEEAFRVSTETITTLQSQTKHTREALGVLQVAWGADEAQHIATEAAAVAAEAMLTTLRGERERLTAASSELATKLALSNAKLQSEQATHESNVAKVEAGRGTYESVAIRKHAIQSLQQHLASLADALRDQALAVSNQTQAQSAFALLEQHPAFGDVVTAEANWVAATESKANADVASRDASRRLKSFLDGIAKVKALCETRTALVAGNADLMHLAELFNPGRGADSGLHIYVLQALFANVVEAANLRFETLLGGRFHLVATRDEAGDGRGVLGLGLSVQDGLTGKSRPATSLSGGETFCASLALALGLADVVRMGAGGIEIGSLFIDEGFGSLDPRPLEDVMTMLHQLGSNGRLVGLISHVPEMKTAIPEKITVIQAGEDRPTKLEVSWM